jgi:hypothetical protein
MSCRLPVKWMLSRELRKTKTELRGILTEAIRNTQQARRRDHDPRAEVSCEVLDWRKGRNIWLRTPGA